MPTSISFQAQIISALGKMWRELGASRPDHRSNEGAALGEAFFWDTIQDYAKKRSDDLWDKLGENGIIKDEEQRKTLTPGDHVLSESPRFRCFAKVTQPVRRFQPDSLAEALRKSKYKVPTATTIELVEKAKVPSTSQVKLSIIEKGV